MSANVNTQCPETGRAFSTAYNAGCRCDACKAWNRAKSERQRRRRGDAVQLRKQPGVVLCPLTAKTPPTAFRDGCRCDLCLGYARGQKRRSRAKISTEQAKKARAAEARHARRAAAREGRRGVPQCTGVVLGQPWTPERRAALRRDAQHAFRTDVEYSILMAQAAWAIIEEREQDSELSG